ncbi:MULTISPECIES: hypothetical protein [Herbaspirillum]|uniref:Uncharacterized protein n=2 Tax=Herbaspirillum huttiense TaxID=863372 RepID=A0AAJ2HAK9_9BURK|nr:MULTISPECIES: hypothetical protein [Herbaspirillum]MDR9836946.1 hypothetical protein [Herbaspirillum huttiense]
MPTQTAVSDSEKIKHALYERSQFTLIATDEDVRSFQDCEAAGFSFESAIGLFFLQKTIVKDNMSRVVK